MRTQREIQELLGKAGSEVTRRSLEGALGTLSEGKKCPLCGNVAKGAAKSCASCGYSFSKYGASKVHTDEGIFDSKFEYQAWCDLRTRERAGDITELRRQVEYDFSVNDNHVFTYRADFVYREKDGTQRIVDAKGVKLPVFMVKMRCLLAAGVEVYILDAKGNFYPAVKQRKKK